MNHRPCAEAAAAEFAGPGRPPCSPTLPATTYAAGSSRRVPAYFLCGGSTADAGACIAGGALMLNAVLLVVGASAAWKPTTRIVDSASGTLCGLRRAPIGVKWPAHRPVESDRSIGLEIRLLSVLAGQDVVVRQSDGPLSSGRR